MSEIKKLKTKTKTKPSAQVRGQIYHIFDYDLWFSIYQNIVGFISDHEKFYWAQTINHDSTKIK